MSITLIMLIYLIIGIVMSSLDDIHGIRYNVGSAFLWLPLLVSATIFGICVRILGQE